MSWFSRLSRPVFAISMFVAVSLSLAACQVQPLNADKPGPSITNSDLSGIDVLEVKTRVAQQVRNHLIFGLNGGGHPDGATHTLALVVKAVNTNISIATSTQAPTAAQVSVTATYTLKDKSSNETQATGIRQVVASYDRTSQSFANQRAERDAEDRAAREVAEQLRLAISAALAVQ